MCRVNIQNTQGNENSTKTCGNVDFFLSKKHFLFFQKHTLTLKQHVAAIISAIKRKITNRTKKKVLRKVSARNVLGASYAF